MITPEKHVLLAPYTTFGIGGKADFFVIAQSQEDILEALAFAKEKHIEFFLLGTGANILIGDKGFRGLVIKNEANKTLLEDVMLTAESGATMSNLIDYTCHKGLSGLEHFAGIPSSVGGALWQNLHFLSPDRSKTVYIGDTVAQAKIVKMNGEILHVDKSYFQFSYDWSILHRTRDIVLDVTFALTPENSGVIAKRIAANKQWRDEKHPDNAMKTSAGSIFRKLEGYGAGRLVQQVGLKGYRIGGAKVSEKHANFVINDNGATAKDVRNLISLIQEKVKKELGLQLETEISFVGEF
ncbi:MAG TPA: UDP-N-acetylmuramate dehydrogenase [Patescibacteria group bacterium]|nr:UDP-N-acetylmuramate dehydrogenase [Patescibacteria group bacterium]